MVHLEADAGLRQLVREHAEGAPGAAAILSATGESVSYAQLDAHIRAYGSVLRQAGTGPGDRIAILGTGAELAIAVLGVVSHAAAAPLDPRSSSAELRALLSGLEPRLLLAQHAVSAPVYEVAKELGIEVRPFLGRLSHVPTTDRGEWIAPRPEDVALILHTSGTTGKPQRVPLTQAGLVASARAIARSLQLDPGDRCLNPMPVHHGHGLIGGLLAALSSGGSSICANGASPDELLDLIARAGTTWVTGSPTIHRAMLEAAENRGRCLSAPSLRLMRSCSAALTPGLQRDLEATFQVPVVQAYGMTEAAHQIASTPLPPSPHKIGSVGVPTGTELRIVDRNGVPVEAEVEGEIEVRGPSVMLGYLDDEPASRAVLREGWLRTGDLGTLDGDGWLRIVGRLKEMINRGGESISPSEVDVALLECPAVAQAAAFGVPHPRLGEDVAAAVVLRPDASIDETELRQFLRALLSPTKVPARIQIVDHIPTTSTGKPARKRLAATAMRSANAAQAACRTETETPLQQRLGAIWADVLRVALVEPEDNFFADLGGDSLLAIQVAMRANVPARLLFDHPKLASFARAVAELVPSATPPPVRLDSQVTEGPLPTSFAQEQLWLLSRLHPGDVAYNTATAARLRGPLDLGALQRAWLELTHRHVSLRTHFRLAPEGPLQVVAELGESSMAVIPVESVESAITQARHEAQRPYDLDAGPLAHATLFQITPEDHVLLVGAHHAVLDGWSAGILARDLASLYQGAQLQRLPLQFADFAAWQRDFLTGPAADASLDCWRRQLTNVPHVLDLAEHQTRSDREMFPNVRADVHLDNASVRALRGLAHEHGATLFMALVAAVNVLVWRRTRQTEFLIGTPASGRPSPECDGVIGCFANLLPLRADLRANPSFRQLIERVRTTTVEALEHGHVPLELIVQALQPPREVGRSPLVQVTCALDTLASRELYLPGVQAEPVAVETDAAKFDLSFTFRPTEADTLKGLLEYRADLFSKNDAAELLREFQEVVDLVTAQPDRALAELLPQTPRPAPAEFPVWCLHERFAEHVRLQPESVAVTCENDSLTYAELDHRAEQLAQRLRARGVTRGTIVGLCVERGLSVPVGILGILKAGGAYLPLDAAYPADRLAYMLSDSGAPLVVTTSDLAQQLNGAPAETLLLEAPAERSEQTSSQDSVSDPADLAYVIYTSGSTGQPKGVMVTHANVARLFSATNEWFDFGPGDVWTMFHSYAFDFSVWEIFGALLYGGRLVNVPRLVSRSPDQFLDLLRRERVTVLNQTPSAFRQLIQADLARPAVEATSLRAVIFGGEALDPRSLQPWVDRYGDSHPRLVNMYGITETTVHVTYRPITRADLDSATSPIGVAIPDLQLHVLDELGKPVPTGEIGELYVSGAGLALGYLGRPELTRERFIESRPIDSCRESRLYRSGDRVRLRADGELEYHGRVDQQVKVRGFRIEPGEVEAALKSHPMVDDALVLARATASDETILVAYILTDGSSLSAPDLRSHLLERLPEHMVPSAFVPLRAWPLTANGKLDRAALPPPGATQLASGGYYVPPETFVQARLAELFAEILDVPQVGIDDDFFVLGGTSLRAAQVIGRARGLFGVDPGMVAIFEQPTVRGLSERIDVLRAAPRTDDRERLEIRRVPRDGSLPVSLPQERVWFLEQLHPGNQAYVFQGQLRLSGELDLYALERSLSDIVSRHEIFRTTFVVEDGQPRQVIGAPWSVHVPIVDLTGFAREQRETEAQRVIASELARRFDLSTLPLARWTLLRLAEREHILLQMEHHVVHDGWSFRLFLRELSTLYASYVAGQSPGLAELSIQFADFATWQRQWLQSAAAAEELEYWKATLKDAPDVLELPTDRPRPAVMTFRGTSRRLQLPTDLVAQLRDLANAEGTSLFMLMLAAFDALLYRYTRETDICVGSGFANRSTPQTEALMGMLVNTVVLRTRLEPELRFRDLLARVRQTCLGAYAHQNLPIDRVVEALRPGRDPSRNPAFQVMFSFHDAPMPVPEFPGLEVQLTEVLSNGSAKFDLNVIGIPDSPDSGQLTLVWEYATDLFDAATIERMARHYKQLLQSVVAAPAGRISQLALMSAEDQRQLAAWGRNPRPYPREASIQDLFADQARRTPMAVALTFETRSFTYAEVDRRANQLANLLRASGVQPGDVVGVCFPRSPELIVALLGILKSGAAYLPLDPQFPNDRVRYMLDDARARVVVTSPGLEQRLPAAMRSVVFDNGFTALDAESDVAPDVQTASDQLAYVMYTSGSSGPPKAVLVPHRAVVRLVKGCDYVSLGPEEVMLQLATPAFDASTFEIWGALLNGARLAIFPTPGGRLSLLELGAFLQRENVSTLWLTAGLFQEMVDAEPAAFARVRQLLAGGDVLSAVHVRKLLECVPGIRITNGYGPTENTTFTCCYSVASSSSFGDSVPIGRPIANTSVCVLDSNGQLAPIGVPGELYAGGDGLALGYLNAPELTAERFVDDPFSSAAGARLYRTGDLVRWRADGALEFLGRMDQQVKVRGFRVEPGEIENTLLSHPAIRECAVLAPAGADGHRRLVAYVVPSGATPASSELREFVRRRLPDYMVPSIFVSLDRLPLTANGKVDRKALPAAEPATQEPGGRTAPVTDIEQRMALLWADALGVPAVGIHDNFFDLGGHSLLAARLFARIEREFGVSLPLMSLFPDGTVARLAALISSERTHSSSSRLVLLEPGGAQPPLILIHPLDGDVLRFSPLARLLGRDRPVYGVRARGLEPGETPHTSVEDMAAEYATLIQSAQLTGPLCLAGFSSGAFIAFALAHELQVRGVDVANLVLLDARAPISADRPWSRKLRQLGSDLIWYAAYAARHDQRGRLLKRQMAQLREWITRGSLFPDRDTVLEQIISEISDFSERHLAVARAQQAAIDRYAPRAYTGRLTVIRARVQLLLTSHEPFLGWDALAGSAVEVRHVPGRHEEMFEPRYVKALAAQLASILPSTS